MSTVLITGCSSGYGKTTADLFLKNGWNVIATMRKPDASLFEEGPGKLLVLPLDVTSNASIDKAIKDGIEAFGQIDVLVNNAGIGLLSAFEITPDETIREIFETNTFGVMAVTRAIIPHLRERGAGTIINVTSSVGIAPMPMTAVYCSSKAAIEGFSESLMYEMATLGIRVKIVEPGYGPNTAFTANSMGRMDGLVSAPYEPFLAFMMTPRDQPNPITEADDVSKVVYQAATDDTKQVRYPAGPDAEYMAQSRWGTQNEAFLQGMRPVLLPPEFA
jgi:NAD(P)-dependent dehydrogenase (short-subunit alcohol dehydrogenase family)